MSTTRTRLVPALAALLALGCTTKFDRESDGDTSVDTPTDSTDTSSDVEVPEGCGNGTVEEGEECEGDMSEPCNNECDIAGHRECNPDTCHWGPCLADEVCDSGCDDDGDTLEDCADTDDCSEDPACQGCIEDRLENNDVPDQSYNIEAPTTYDELTICPGDDDYYAAQIPAGQRLNVELNFVHAEGNIDAELLSEGSRVAESISEDDGELITWASAMNATYLLRVYLAGDSGEFEGNEYSMVVGMEPDCIDDDLEPNDDTTSATHVSVGNYPHLHACPDEFDFYRLYFSASSMVPIDITLTFSHAEGDIDLHLFDASGSLLADSASIDDNESLSYTFPAGVFFIRVSLHADAGTIPGNSYTMDIID